MFLALLSDLSSYSSLVKYVNYLYIVRVSRKRHRHKERYHKPQKYFFLTSFYMQIIEWKSDGGANFAGVICYVFGLLIWVTTLPPVRKRYFELFYYTHHLYVLFIIFFALHVGDTYFSKAAGGIFLFMLDRFLRFWQSQKNVNVISTTCYPCGTVKLVLSKPGSKISSETYCFLVFLLYPKTIELPL